MAGATDSSREGIACGVLLVRERGILALEANDEGTNALMSDYIREQEKTKDVVPRVSFARAFFWAGVVEKELTIFAVPFGPFV